MLTTTVPTQPFDVVRWARLNHWLPYDPRGVITDIPGAGVLTTRRIPYWPALQSHAGYVNYWPAQPRLLAGLGRLGESIFDILSATAEREVGSEVERKVRDAAKRYIIPPMALGVGISLIALAVAVSAQRSAQAAARKANRRHRRSRRR